MLDHYYFSPPPPPPSTSVHGHRTHNLFSFMCQKRPTTVSKETYYSVKRDLLQCQKRRAAGT